jgi:hypothetical protein
MDTTSLKRDVDELGQRVAPKLEEAKEQLGRFRGRVTTFIQDHPAACLLGAIGLGYVVARIARR